MNKKIKTAVKITVFFLFLLVTCSAFGFGGSKGVAEAQKFVDVGRTDRAIEILRDWTNKEAKDFEAYWMLANLYMQRSAYGQAEEQFGYALNLKPGKQKEVTEKYKKAFKHEVASGNIHGAKSMAQRVINFEPAYKQQVYASLYAKGKTSSGQMAVDNFDTALAFASTQVEREKIGKNFLKLALENSQSKYMVDKATNILGKEFVGQVLPGQHKQVIFSNTYTEADLDADGKVEILNYAKTQVLPGDVFMVYVDSRGDYGAKVDFSDGEQLKIRSGGNLRCKFEVGDDFKNGRDTVSFDKGHETKIRTELIRTIEKKTNYTLLGGI